MTERAREAQERTMNNNITSDDIESLRHMLGMDSREPGFRNYYVTDGPHPGMARLVAAGLVEPARQPSWMNEEDRVFRATRAGKHFVGLESSDV